MRRKMNQTNRGSNAIRLPWFCYNAVHRVAFRVERPPAKFAKFVALDQGYGPRFVVNPPHAASPFAKIQSNEKCLPSDVYCPLSRRLDWRRKRRHALFFSGNLDYPARGQQDEAGVIGGYRNKTVTFCRNAGQPLPLAIDPFRIDQTLQFSRWQVMTAGWFPWRHTYSAGSGSGMSTRSSLPSAIVDSTPLSVNSQSWLPAKMALRMNVSAPAAQAQAKMPER